MNIILISGGRLTDAGARALEALVRELGTDAPVETMRARVLAADIEIVPTETGRAPRIEVREHAGSAAAELAPCVISGGELTPGAAERIAEALAGAGDRFDRILVLEPAS